MSHGGWRFSSGSYVLGLVGRSTLRPSWGWSIRLVGAESCRCVSPPPLLLCRAPRSEAKAKRTGGASPCGRGCSRRRRITAGPSEDRWGRGVFGVVCVQRRRGEVDAAQFEANGDFVLDERRDDSAPMLGFPARFTSVHCCGRSCAGSRSRPPLCHDPRYESSLHGIYPTVFLRLSPSVIDRCCIAGGFYRLQMSI